MLDANRVADGLPDPKPDEADTPPGVPGPIERREKRVGTNVVGTVRLPDGTEFTCVVRDVSQSGARLGVPSSRALPDRFLFKMHNRDLVFQVRLAWRKESYAGVRIERIAKLPSARKPG